MPDAFQRVSSIRFGLLVSIVLAMQLISPAAAQAQTPTGKLVISEFRLRGPNGANDEFIEIYNNTPPGSGAFVVSATSGTGFGIAASDGVTRCTIPNGTVINVGGTFLCVNSVGYSLAAYPSRNTPTATTATGDATYTIDIPDNAGIALFNNNTGGANYSLANRLDAVGSTAETNTLYKEGTGYPALTPFSIEYSFVRDECGKEGSIATFGPCPSDAHPVDTDNNATNFIFVSTNAESVGAGQRLGAPGPQNLSSPRSFPGSFPALMLDRNFPATGPPNRVRDLTPNPANNSTFGTLEFRRLMGNGSGLPILELRFRIIDLTTSPAPAGIADLRALTSADIEISGITDPITCGGFGSPPPPCTITVRGTTLEMPPSQPNGGGFNASLRLNGPATGLENIKVRFVFGVQQTGLFKFYIKGEAIQQSFQP